LTDSSSSGSDLPKRTLARQHGVRHVGHPVDVASGAVYTSSYDAWVSGKFDLVWEREYHSGFTESAPGPLGPGWAVRDFFARLQQEPGGYRFANGREEEFFEDPDGSIERGGVVRQLRSSQELAHDGRRYVVTRWDGDTGTVERLIFLRGRSGEPWPIVAVEDVRGQGVDILYDAAGSIAAIRQRREQLSLLPQYHANGLVASLLLSDGEQTQLVVRYDYDERGRLAAAADPLDIAYRYEYDARHRLTREVFRDGAVFTFSYDANGRCFRTAGLDGYDEKTMRYMDAIRTTTVADSHGSVSLFRYLPSGQVVSETTPIGGVWQTGYDDFGRVVEHINPLGGARRYAYDEIGNLVSVEEETGSVHRFAYNAARQLTLEVDPNGGEWHREYDSRGYVIADRDPLGHRTEYQHDGLGDLVRITNAQGASMLLTYDRHGRVVAETDYEGHVRRFDYDLYVMLTQHIDPLGHETLFRYDAARRLISVAYPDGTGERFEYDSGGNPIVYVDRAGRVVRRRFGTCGRLLEEVRPDGTTIRQVWDSEPERLTSVVNEKGEVYQLGFDPAGNIIEEVGFDGLALRFRRDAAGNVVEASDPIDRVTRFTRDAAGRLLAVAYPDGRTTRMQYNPNGLVAEAVTADATIQLTYDAYDNIVSETIGAWQVANQYDELGNRVARRIPGQALAFDYDRNGRLAGISRDGRSIVRISNDPLGRESQRVLLGGVRVHSEYDSMSQLVRRYATVPRGGVDSVLGEHTYQYDPAGDLVVRRDPSGDVRYEYDTGSRLLRAEYSDGRSESFQYDLSGNITEARRLTAYGSGPHVYGPGDRLLSVGSTRFEYGARGEVVQRHQQSGAASTDVWQFQWDPAGQLRAVSRPDGTTVEYGYDALGRRTFERDEGGERRYFWDDDALCEVQNGTTQLRYYFDADLIPVFKERDASTYTFLTDHIGTPAQAFDAFGGLAWSGEPSAWGPWAKETGIAGFDNVRFPGQWLAPRTGLHYNRYRYYDPGLGRYYSQDPARLLSGLNTYAYAINPIVWTDPFGLGPESNSSGQSGESRLDRHYPGGQSGQVYDQFRPARAVDRFYPGAGPNGQDVLRESKSGRQGYSTRIKGEVRRDAALVKAGNVVEWHFFASPVTGKRGPTAKLAKALAKAGITVVCHPPPCPKKKKGCGR
jgi:RHS repeat-associated protein